jgi:HK97 family phage prohead protease
MDERAAARVGGQVTNPGATERLHEYWVHGPGAAKIRWGEPSDFARCVEHLGKFIKDPQGYCNLAHKAALGFYPATHAAMEHKAGRSQVADAKAPYGDVAYGDPGYLDADGNQASKSGKPGVKRYPLSADKVMAAWSYINQAKNAGQYTPAQLAGIKGRVKAAMAKAGHDTADQPAAASRAEYMRLYALEDIHILRSADGGDGRTVEAYAAVFGEPAEIQDHEGHYTEEIDPGAFNRAIDHASRGRGGFPGAVKVLWNHGRDLSGAASDRFSMPIGIPVDIRAETRGLLTRTRYSETPLADEVLENIRAGSITSQSFTGRIMRSDPQLRRGDRYRPQAGALTTVRRTELGLREYGPVLWPAYSGAEILGVRMSTPGSWSPDPDEIDEGTGTPPDEGPAAGDPLATDEHSARYHQHALYALRSQEMREKYGLAW